MPVTLLSEYLNYLAANNAKKMTDTCTFVRLCMSPEDSYLGWQQMAVNGLAHPYIPGEVIH